MSPFCRHQHTFPEGRQYLDSHSLLMRDLGMAQGETTLLPAIVGPHNIRRQHSLMLWWVLLCDYCSCLCHLPKTSELGRAINAHITVVVYFRDHCLWFRVCSFAALYSAFIIPAPEGAAVVYINTPFIFELHVMSMGHACLVCTQFIFYTPYGRSSSTGSLLPPTGNS